MSLMPFMDLLGMELVISSKDEVRVRLPWRDEVCTTNGIMHGGAIMSLADTAGAICAFNNLPDGAGTTTIESKTNFLRAVKGGAAGAVARPLHAGRTVVVIETDVLDGDGRRVARVTQTQAVLSPPA
jgi:uncharacterized protein (TIGR00369 family)